MRKSPILSLTTIAHLVYLSHRALTLSTLHRTSHQASSVCSIGDSTCSQIIQSVSQGSSSSLSSHLPFTRITLPAIQSSLLQITLTVLDFQPTILDDPKQTRTT